MLMPYFCELNLKCIMLVDYVTSRCVQAKDSFFEGKNKLKFIIITEESGCGHCPRGCI